MNIFLTNGPFLADSLKEVRKSQTNKGVYAKGYAKGYIVYLYFPSESDGLKALEKDIKEEVKPLR